MTSLTPHPMDSEWEEEFNEKYHKPIHECYRQGDGSLSASPYELSDSIKSFIRLLLAEQREAMVKMVKAMRIKQNENGCYDKGDDGNTYIMNCEYGNCQHYGYNKALKDLLTKLKSKQ